MEPPVDSVIVYVVPVEIVTLLVGTGLEETPVGPTGLDVLLVPVTGATGVELPVPDRESVPVRGRLE